MTYASRNGPETSRTVEPLGLMQHEGRWFLAANCLLRAGLRLFRVDRIQSVEGLGEEFEAPEDFDLRAFLYERIALAAAPWQVEVWLELPPGDVESRLPRAMAMLEAEGTGTRRSRRDRTVLASGGLPVGDSQTRGVGGGISCRGATCA
jgi:hypothetical protein